MYIINAPYKNAVQELGIYEEVENKNKKQFALNLFVVICH